MSALDDFVVRSATNYLQSVVFVDDRIYAAEVGMPLQASPAAGFGGGLKPQFVPAEPVVSDVGDAVVSIEGANAQTELPAPAGAFSIDEAQIADVSRYHPRELMESFAQSGIVCALYEPRLGFKTDPGSDLFRLCERADVVILDWDLYNDDGDGVSELLAGLIKKSAAELPHHVRLCALYTSRPSLHPVLDTLLSKLVAQGCSVDAEEGLLRLQSGATRVSIFGKPVTLGRPPDDKMYEVKEADLARRIIVEFASFHCGLLPAFALHGLAAVRRNTKRLLDKFRAELDGSFLLQRALVLGDSDAFDELPELLSDEIRAVLEDSWPEAVPLEEVAAAVSDGLALAEPVQPWRTRAGGKPCDAKAVFRAMLKGENGMNEAREISSNVKNPSADEEIKPALLKDFETMLTLNGTCWQEHLAALFCVRTQYAGSSRRLGFGTIVRHRDEGEAVWRYSICLMPICDSQRLNQTWRFPFWVLEENAKSGVSGKRNGIVVIDPEGQPHSLAAGGKIRKMLWLAEFTPDASRSVVAVLQENRFRFTTPGRTVEWIAELKHLHAQRIASHMGAEVSRVGLVESEWLRLLCDR